MSDDTTDDTATESAAGEADYRQVSFVALAALALVLAAAFAPGMSGESGSSPGFDVDWDGGDGNGPDVDADRDGSGDGNGDGGGDAPEIGFDWRQLFEWITVDTDDESAETEGSPQCVITLDREPVPGHQLTATIHYEGEPLADTPVWFEDRRVGETDENGRVTGEVPYVKELTIRVGAETDATCRAGTSTGLSSTTSGTTAGMLSSGAKGTTGWMPSSVATKSTASASPATTAAVARIEQPQSISTRGATSIQDDASGNATGTYPVDADVRLDVDGDPYPGETIVVEARIENEPMRDATVSVDGTTVGETDDDGTAAVTVPEDGTDAFELEVSRGDFAGTTTVDVLLLEASLVPDGLAPVPGSDGAVVATINGTPVEGAQVAVDGEPAGTTGEDGRLAIGVPRDPTTTVTVTTARQTASVSLLGAYGGAALLVAVVVAGLAALSTRPYGRRGPIAVLGTAGAVTGVLVVEAFYGRAGGFVALGVVALVGLGVVVSRSDRGRPAVGIRDAPSLRDRLDRLASRLVALALRAVDRLEALLERGRALAGAVREWLRSLPRSGRSLSRRFADWLRTLPGRVRTRLATALAAVRTLPLRTAAAVLGALPLIGGGYVVDGTRGAALVTTVLAIAGVVLFRSDGTATESTDSAAGGIDRPDEEPTDDEPEPAADERRSFRDLWRAFARRVAPGSWRTRTPGEIERRARSQGYPREPVRELTTLFREVEYGGRPRSSDRRERAADAYDAVERARDADRTDESGAETDPESATEGQP